MGSIRTYCKASSGGNADNPEQSPQPAAEDSESGDSLFHDTSTFPNDSPKVANPGAEEQSEGTPSPSPARDAVMDEGLQNEIQEGGQEVVSAGQSGPLAVEQGAYDSAGLSTSVPVEGNPQNIGYAKLSPTSGPGNTHNEVAISTAIASTSKSTFRPMHRKVNSAPSSKKYGGHPGRGKYMNSYQPRPRRSFDVASGSQETRYHGKQGNKAGHKFARNDSVSSAKGIHGDKRNIKDEKKEPEGNHRPKERRLFSESVGAPRRRTRGSSVTSFGVQALNGLPREAPIPSLPAPPKAPLKQVPSAPAAAAQPLRQEPSNMFPGRNNQKPDEPTTPKAVQRNVDPGNHPQGQQPVIQRTPPRPLYISPPHRQQQGAYQSYPQFGPPHQIRYGPAGYNHSQFQSFGRNGGQHQMPSQIPSQAMFSQNFSNNHQRMHNQYPMYGGRPMMQAGYGQPGGPGYPTVYRHQQIHSGQQHYRPRSQGMHARNMTAHTAPATPHRGRYVGQPGANMPFQSQHGVSHNRTSSMGHRRNHSLNTRPENGGHRRSSSIPQAQKYEPELPLLVRQCTTKDKRLLWPVGPFIPWDTWGCSPFEMESENFMNVLCTTVGVLRLPFSIPFLRLLKEVVRPKFGDYVLTFPTMLANSDEMAPYWERCHHVARFLRNNAQRLGWKSFEEIPKCDWPKVEIFFGSDDLPDSKFHIYLSQRDEFRLLFRCVEQKLNGDDKEPKATYFVTVHQTGVQQIQYSDPLTLDPKLELPTPFGCLDPRTLPEYQYNLRNFLCHNETRGIHVSGFTEIGIPAKKLQNHPFYEENYDQLWYGMAHLQEFICMDDMNSLSKLRPDQDADVIYGRGKKAELERRIETMHGRGGPKFEEHQKILAMNFRTKIPKRPKSN
ncbi:hypothetical protein ABW19_dt0205300 [Dactylella cylindrospora]|nr:hypothetical protein ABW19_dt0205300 [Dactylella cylindrospora]